MQFEGAVVREQGITFAVVIVKKYIVDNANDARSAISGFTRFFPGMPVVLMGQDPSGRATYFGRPDIAKFLSRISPNRLSWKRYTI